MRDWLERKFASDFRARGRTDAAWAGKLGEFHAAFAAAMADQFADVEHLEALDALRKHIVQVQRCGYPTF